MIKEDFESLSSFVYSQSDLKFPALCSSFYMVQYLGSISWRLYTTSYHNCFETYSNLCSVFLKEYYKS